MSDRMFHVRGTRRDEITADDKRMMANVAELKRCMLCGRRGDVQVCHSDQMTDGKAFGLKSHPALVAAMCADCHLQNGHARDNKEIAFNDWDQAYKRTIAALYDAGKLKPV